MPKREAEKREREIVVRALDSAGGMVLQVHVCTCVAQVIQGWQVQDRLEAVSEKEEGVKRRERESL